MRHRGNTRFVCVYAWFNKLQYLYAAYLNNSATPRHNGQLAGACMMLVRSTALLLHGMMAFTC